jgi:hypothetical protein
MDYSKRRPRHNQDSQGRLEVALTLMSHWNGLSVYIPFNGRKWTELGISAKGGLTNEVLGYIATSPSQIGIAT